MSKITLIDVAALAHVSKSSVSNYFNNPERLAKTTRERIHSAVTALGFTPNEAARALRSVVRPVVGYIAFELASAHTPEIARALEHHVAERNMYLLMANDDGLVERERSYLQLFEMQRVSGIIISPIGDVESELLQLRERGIPSVLSSRLAKSPQLASVSTDHVAGGVLAVEHLISLGRRRIGFVASALELQQVHDRLNGALSVIGASPGASLEVIPVPERTVAAGIKCGEALLRRNPADRPDAIFCANDLLAIGMVQALAASSDISVPHDIAIVGYDDIEFAGSTVVPLTSVRTPDHELGIKAAELLFNEFDLAKKADGDEYLQAPRPHIEFKPELIVRASTRI